MIGARGLGDHSPEPPRRSRLHYLRRQKFFQLVWRYELSLRFGRIVWSIKAHRKKEQMRSYDRVSWHVALGIVK